MLHNLLVKTLTHLIASFDSLPLSKYREAKDLALGLQCE